MIFEQFFKMFKKSENTGKTWAFFDNNYEISAKNYVKFDNTSKIWNQLYFLHIRTISYILYGFLYDIWHDINIKSSTVKSVCRKNLKNFFHTTDFDKFNGVEIWQCQKSVRKNF